MVGKYQGDFDLFGSGAIAAELKRQLGGKLEVLRRNLQVGSPLRREGDVYYLSGNAPHRGGGDQAYILFDAGHRALQVGLWENGKLGIHSTPGSAIAPPARSEEHTSELQSLMRISYAVFCLKKKKQQ